MNKPIQNQEELLKTVKYIATESSKMAKKVIGLAFPIKSVTVFSHSEQEFELLTGILSKLGKPYNYNNGPRVELHEVIQVNGNRITHLRIRKPDGERPQVGCNDFEADYKAFKRKYLEKYPENLSMIRRPEYQMIELRDEGFDVLAYFVSKSV